MRKKVMAFNAKVNAWILKRLKGVWLDPIFCAVFAVMCLVSFVCALRLHKSSLYYSTAIWAIATLLCLRRIQRIKKYEKEQAEGRKTEEN